MEKKIIYLPMNYTKYSRYMNGDYSLNDEDLPYELRKCNENDNFIRKNFDASIFNRKYAEENMHFFRYNQHAQSALPCLGKYIEECHVPSELVEETFGAFRYKGMEYFPIPEYVIKRRDFSWEYMKGYADFNSNNCRNILGTDVYPCRDAKVYNSFVKDTYKTWKRLNPKNNDPYAFYHWFIYYFEKRGLDDALAGFKDYSINTKKRVR